MQLLDKNGVKNLASAILNKIKNSHLILEKLGTFKKGVCNYSYNRFLNTNNSQDPNVMYENFDGTHWRLCTGQNRDINDMSKGFDPIDEAITVSFEEASGRIALGRHTIPERNDEFTLGSPNYRWKTVYAVNTLNTSSKGYKTNIEYISKADTIKTLKDDMISTTDMYSFVKDLPLATFDYATSKDIQKQDKAVGFIAEDIKDSKIGNLFVFDVEEGAMFNPVSYCSILAGAIQELMLKVETLESQLASQKEA